MSCLFNPVVNELKYSPSVFACLPGISVLTGVALLALLVPFNAWIANQQKRFQEENLVLKDARIKMVNEILNGMKVTLLFLFSLCELCMDSSLWVLYALLCLNGVFIPLCECCLHSSVWMVSGLFCVNGVWILQCEWSDKTDTRSVIIFFFQINGTNCLQVHIFKLQPNMWAYVEHWSIKWQTAKCTNADMAVGRRQITIMTIGLPC